MKKFPSVSYADLWIYAACVAIEEMGGEKAKSGTCWGGWACHVRVGLCHCPAQGAFHTRPEGQDCKGVPCLGRPHLQGALLWMCKSPGLSLSLSVPEDGRLPSADMGSPDKTATHLRLIFNRALRKKGKAAWRISCAGHSQSERKSELRISGACLTPFCRQCAANS